MKSSLTSLLLFLFLIPMGQAKSTTSVNPGDWTTPATWDNGLPVSGDFITIATTVNYNTNFSCGGSGSLEIINGGFLFDGPGGAAYDFFLKNTADLTLNGGNMTIGGLLEVSNNTNLIISGCNTLTFGEGNFSNSGLMSVDSCSAMIGLGNLEISNSFQIGAGGFIRITGDVELANSAEITGDGNFFATGCIEFKNSSSMFGINADCCGGPCFFGTGFPLPLDLAYFTLEKYETDVRLEWASYNEVNVDIFVVQRSANLVQWEALGEVQSQAFSNDRHTYEHFDRSPQYDENTYYRLKMIDLDGSFKYSQVLSLNKVEQNETHIYPNPVTSVLYVPNNAGEMLGKMPLAALYCKALERN